MINTHEIIETIKMVKDENLDIRTITMGISLLDCSSFDGKASRQKIYDKITRYAKDLVKTGEDIERDFGIPIINKRISVTPMSLIAASSNDIDYTEFAIILDKAARETGVNFIGGFSALVHKGFTKGDDILINSLPSALSHTQRVCSSVNVATTKAAIKRKKSPCRISQSRNQTRSLSAFPGDHCLLRS